MLFLTKLSLKMWKEVWQQPRGTPKGRRRREEWEKGQPIYREYSLPTPCRTCGRPATLMYVHWFLHIGPEGVSYIQVLSKGYSKSSVRLVVPPCTSALQTEAYVRHLRISIWLHVLKLKNVSRWTLRVFRSSSKWLYQRFGLNGQIKGDLLNKRLLLSGYYTLPSL
jgi:hypothetical protein